MFVICSATGCPPLPQFLSNNFINCERDIAAISNRGITHVLIDSSKIQEPVAQPQSHSYSDEIRFARDAYNKALEAIHKFYSSAAQGEPINVSECQETVCPIIESLGRNNNAATSLTILAKKEKYIFTHSVNTAILSALIGKHLGLEKDTVVELSTCGLLMNIGHIWTPEKILYKQGKLTGNEFEVIKNHPELGYSYLKKQGNVSEEILRGVLEHHERVDGSGYPRGITLENISRFAWILSIVDTYDAMTSDRPFRTALTPNQAIKQIYSMKDVAFHPRYLEHFIKCVGIYPVGCFVKLSDGRFGVVMSLNNSTPLKPSIKIVFDSKFRAIHPEYLDLANQKDINGPKIEITECIHPKTFKLELDRFLW